MDIILHETTKEQLMDANISNLLNLFRKLGDSPKAEYRDEDGMARWRTDIPHPWFRGVISARPMQPSDRVFVQDMVTYFRSRGVDTFTWWIEPGYKGQGWEKLLLEEGLHVDQSTPVMGAALSKINFGLAAPGGLRIVQVESLDELHTWSSVFIRGYGMPEAFLDPFNALFEGIGMALPLRYYMGVLDEEPVGAALLYLSAGVAGVYNIATLPHMRGRGIGAALTLAPLKDAQAMSFDYGILQSSEMGYNLYRRLGFERLGELENYYWSE